MHRQLFLVKKYSCASDDKIYFLYEENIINIVYLTSSCVFIE